jgi:hypothetical protein
MIEYKIEEQDIFGTVLVETTTEETVSRREYTKDEIEKQLAFWIELKKQFDTIKEQFDLIEEQSGVVEESPKIPKDKGIK